MTHTTHPASPVLTEEMRRRVVEAMTFQRSDWDLDDLERGIDAALAAWNTRDPAGRRVHVAHVTAAIDAALPGLYDDVAYEAYDAIRFSGRLAPPAVER